MRENAFNSFESFAHFLIGMKAQFLAFLCLKNDLI
jgi:phosphoketolase